MILAQKDLSTMALRVDADSVIVTSAYQYPLPNTQYPTPKDES